MLTSKVLEFLAGKGLSMQDIVELTEIIEGQEARRSANAERQARFRARKAEKESVTQSVTSNASPTAEGVTQGVTRNALAASLPMEREPKDLLEPKVSPPPIVPPQSPPAPRGPRRLPDDWQPDAELIAWVVKQYPSFDWETANEIFIDYWRSSGSSTARKLDWRAAWRNWMRRDATSHKPTAYRSARAARLDGQARSNAERIDRALARRPSDQADDGSGAPRLRLIAGGGGNADS